MILLTAIEKFFIQKQPDNVKEGLLIAFGPAKRSIAVLLDADPNDMEQLKKLWLEFIQNDEPWNYTETQLTQLILLKLGDSKYKDVLLPIIPPVLDSLQILVDEDPENIKQLEAIFDAFVEDSKFEEFVKSLLLIILKKSDPEDVDDIWELIEFFLTGND